MIPTFLAAMALSPLQQAGWTAPNSLILDGSESLGSSKTMPFRIQMAKGKLLLATQRGIGSWPGGATRLESNTSAGFMTWLEGSNRALRLAVASHPDIQTWLQPVRFSKEALLAGTIPGWRSGKAEAVAGRDCWQIASTGNPTQTLWIDQSLGLALRQEDKDSLGRTRYLRVISGFQLNPAVADHSFTPALGLLLQGVPHPSIIARPSLTSPISAYGRDLDGIKKKSKLSADLWLKKMTPPPGFEYVGTQFEESSGKAIQEVWPRNQLGGPEFEPGGLPPGWTATAEVSQDGKALAVRFKSSDASPMVIVHMPKGKEGYSFKITQGEFVDGEMRNSVNIEYVAFLADDGALVMGLGPDGDKARLRRETSKLDLSKASVAVQSDFVEPTSGHTVSFFQVRGREWQTCALLPKLEAPEKLMREGTSFETWTLNKEFPLRVVAWTSSGTTYILASSKLNLDELAALAAKVAGAN